MSSEPQILFDLGMARSRRQIEQSLITSIEATSPDVDVQKGPIYDIFIRPQANEFRGTELKLDDLSRRYSIDYILTQNAAAIDLYGSNHGLRRSSGKPSSGVATFYAYTRLGSGEVISIPQGTVVSTVNPTIAFQTIQDAQIRGDNANAFYNASTRRYEVSVPIESLGFGQEFELPPNRIVRIQTQIQGIDGVLNRARTGQSTTTETSSSFGGRIRLKFNGTAQGSGDGFRQLIQNYNPQDILDTSIVFSTDQNLFRRPTRRSAWDLYLIGQDVRSFTESFVGDGVRTEFRLSRSPVLSVTSVTINGLTTAYSPNIDVGENYGGSTRANDSVRFAAAPSIGSQISVTYEYDELVRSVQEYSDRISVGLYKCEILIRRARQIRTTVKVQIQVLSSFDSEQAQSDTFAAISEFVNPNRFVDILYPGDLSRKISGEVGGASRVRVTEFYRTDIGGTLLEAIEYEANEYPVSSDALIDVEVVR